MFGWGKKVKTKQDDDMTMDEILASIRRYVAEGEQGSDDIASMPHSFDNPELSMASMHNEDEDESPVIYKRNATSKDTKELSNNSLNDIKHDVFREPAQQTQRDVYKESYRDSKPDITLDMMNNLRESSRPMNQSNFDKDFGVTRQSMESNYYGSQTQNDGNYNTSKQQTFDKQSSPMDSLSKLVETARTAQNTANQPNSKNVTLDQLISQLAEPLIKDWMDRHLPRIVEETVQKEISKLTQGLMNNNR
jgi:cell pole-organizing protein PopZ